MCTSKVLMERANDGSYSAYIPDNQDFDYWVMGTGRTYSQAVKDFYDAYEGMKQHYASNGKPFKERDFDIRRDIVSYVEYYAGMFTRPMLARITGLPEKRINDYLDGRRRPSEKTIEKMDEAVRRFGLAGCVIVPED